MSDCWFALMLRSVGPLMFQASKLKVRPLRWCGTYQTTRSSLLGFTAETEQDVIYHTVVNQRVHIYIYIWIWIFTTSYLHIRMQYAVFFHAWYCFFVSNGWPKDAVSVFADCSAVIQQSGGMRPVLSKCSKVDSREQGTFPCDI